MENIAFEKTTLSNGLDVILHEDHSIPLVAVNVWYHVGSKDEELGRTGFAHLFEHVMFEGSKHHNSSHFEPLQKVGANLNGSTTSDRTNYWEDVPSNHLELALWLEADRMGFLVDALDQQRFDIQRDVVKNERRQSYENRPYGMAHWQIQESLFPLPHPYHWMTIGSQEDLDAASLDDVKDFFRRFYSPSNGSLAIAGDIDPQAALEMVDKYFGSLQPGPSVPRFGRFDSGLKGRVELEMRDRVSLPRMYIAWPTPPHLASDDPALELLRGVLSDGLSSRLYKTLVYEKQIAQNAGASFHASEVAGQFVVDVTAAEGHDLDEIQAATEEVLSSISSNPPTEEEIDRAKNRLEAQHYRQLTHIGGFGGRADDLNHFNVFAGDPGMINTSIDDYLKITRDDILRVNRSVLDERQVRLRVLPEKALTASTTQLDRTMMPSPAKEPAFVAPLPDEIQNPNGLNILVLEKHEMPVVSFGLVIPSGTITDPPNKPGLAAFTAQMISEGTREKSSQEIAEAFEFIGARLSAEARREMTLISTETLTKHWKKALKLMAEVVRFPSVPQIELDRVRREHLTDLRRAKDDSGFIAEQVMPGLIFGKDSKYGHSSVGTEDSVSSFTKADIESYFNNYYRPQNATLVVAGDVSLNEAQLEISSVFGDWTNATLVNSGYEDLSNDSEALTTIYLVDKPGAAQSVIRAGHTTISRANQDYFKLVLLNFIFGGQFSARLNQNLRQDKGYSYGFHSSISWFKEASAFVAGGSVQTAVTKESVQEILKEFSDIHGMRPVSSEELTSAQSGMLQGLPAGFERPGQILGGMVQMVLHDLPRDYFRTVGDKLSDVKLKEINLSSQEQVHPEKLTILVVGDRSIIENGLHDLGLPVVVLNDEGEVTE
ncbi:MAG: pitrilysin family protein [Chloroflexota bacterium]|nr:pitrilysin family protein [Chloroflexota bacterium]